MVSWFPWVRSQYGLARSFASGYYRPQSRYLLGLQYYLRLDCESIDLQADMVLVPCRLLNWDSQFLSGCLPKATFNSLLHWSFHIEAHTRQLASSKPTRESHIHSLCHILLVRSKLQVLATLKVGELHKGMNTRIMGITVKSVFHIA